MTKEYFIDTAIANKVKYRKGNFYVRIGRIEVNTINPFIIKTNPRGYAAMLENNPYSLVWDKLYENYKAIIESLN